jgi:hypothetical protein
MHVFTKRNALIGWIVVRLARRRLRRKLRASTGGSTARRIAVGLGAVATSVVTARAVAARRAHASRLEPA